MIRYLLFGKVERRESIATPGFEEMSGGAAELPWLGVPELVAPTWNWSTCVELVIPLAVTVLVVKNGQGAVILRAARLQHAG